VRRVQTASLVLGYSRLLFFQVYRVLSAGVHELT
jgi:hypothetical protein